jgi:gamma-glutamyltranspeptidase / glutathione hydrolase
LAFADRDRWVADPAFAPAPLERLLDPGYAAERAGVVESGRALVDVESGIPLPAAAGRPATPTADAEVGERDGGDTVYLTVVDAQGNAVSWIQSLFASFGSGILEPETGIVLHNRGALYVLDEGHPQVVAPGKRPFHTLTPHMVLRGDELAFTFGTPGGDSQTQTLLQVMHNMELFGMSPQAAVEAPRYRSERELLLEDRIPGISVQGLEAMGYLPEVSSGWTATFGGVQVIRVHRESGVRIVASDPRREAYGLAW